MQIPKDYTIKPLCLKDKIILITGAGDGIGKVAAKSFAASGATVVLMGRTLAKLEAVYDEIEAAGHPQPAIYPINFESAVEKDYIDMCNALEPTFEKIHGILFNAGDLGEQTPISNHSLGAWQRCIQVNLIENFIPSDTLLRALQMPDADASKTVKTSSQG